MLSTCIHSKYIILVFFCFIIKPLTHTASSLFQTMKFSKQIKLCFHYFGSKFLLPCFKLNLMGSSFKAVLSSMIRPALTLI